MAFCPKCRYEYNPEVFKCPDCQEYLVAFLSEEEKSEIEYKDWIRIAVLTSNVDAELISEVLRSKEIPNFVLSGTGFFGETGQMGPTSFTAAGGGYVLLIPREFIEQVDIIGRGVLGEIWEKLKLIES